MDRRQTLQAEVRRQQKKRVATQQVMWFIVAVLAVIGGVFALIRLQDASNNPVTLTKKYADSRKARSKLEGEGCKKTGDMPSFYLPHVTNHWVEFVVDESGQPKPAPEGAKMDTPDIGEPVQVQVELRGEKVAGTTADKDKSGEDTHAVYMRWQRLRDGKPHARGKWLMYELVVQELARTQ